ncbi:MAG TPA: FAD-dependent oxidoreductase [Candidatus Saccharimonas sp.]|nr:FAD-dependent oxidoreductase [Candidatus Saccharimonas sp.]
MIKPIHIIGAGMAGSEAAWQAANAGVPAVLHEMRPSVATDAHKTGGFAELVCSNSFRSDDSDQNAVGLLHWEMRQAGSLIMAMADRHQVPAGGALAVDREAFSAEVTETLTRHPLVSVEVGEIAGLPPQDWDNVIISSFKGIELINMRRRSQKVNLAMLHNENPFIFVAYHRFIQFTAVGFHRLYLNRFALEIAKKAGLFTYAYTVNRPAALPLLEKQGIDGIVTNYPDKFRDWMGQ